MFTITQLKGRGKQTYKKNYWRAVLVALIIAAIGGTQGTSTIESFYSAIIGAISTPIEKSVSESVNKKADKGSDPGRHNSHGDYDEFHYYYDDENIDDYDFGDFFDDYDFDFDDNYYYEEEDHWYEDDWYDDDWHEDSDDYLPNEIIGGDSSFGGELAAAILAVFAIVLVFVIIFAVIVLLVRIFFLNPLEVGCMRFFVSNLNEEGKISSLGYAFDHRYRNQVYIMFMRSLFTFLWSLLCLIPGIYKGYEYRLIPYLLAEYPDLTKEQAFATSKQMMHGYKMKAFLLDLSFIGWWLLNMLTLGILGIFFVGPYYHSTAAAFYEALRGYNGIPGIAAPLWTAPQTAQEMGQDFGEQTFTQTMPEEQTFTQTAKEEQTFAQPVDESGTMETQVNADSQPPVVESMTKTPVQPDETQTNDDADETEA